MELSDTLSLPLFVHKVQNTVPLLLQKDHKLQWLEVFLFYIMINANTL